MMNATEIKKAFETMKKELKKETGIEGGFTMNKKQIEARTATYLAEITLPYENDIESRKMNIERISSFTEPWTEEEKERSIKQEKEKIYEIESRMNKYGTKLNEVITKMEQIKNSKAFRKFSSNFDNVSVEIEEKNNCYYVRFNF